MKKFFIIVCWVPFLSFPLQAGGSSVKSFLLTARNDYTVVNSEKGTGFLKEGSFGGIPFVDDIEFRIREDAYDINRVQYGLRLQPRGIGETRAAGRFNATLLRNSELNTRVLVNNALKDRYLLIIDLLEQKALRQINNDLILLYEDRITVLEKKTTTSTDLGFIDLISAEDENTRIHSTMFDIDKTINVLERKAGDYSGNSMFKEFDTAGFVNSDSIIAIIEKNEFSFDTNNVYLDFLRADLTLAENRYSLEKAEGRRYISYLGFSYSNGDMIDELARRDANKDYNLNYAYRIEAGVSIPFLTTGSHDINRRKASLIAQKDDYERLKIEQAGKMKKDIDDMRGLILQYRFLKTRENQVDATASLKKYLQTSGIDPLVLLSIKESILKNHLAMAKVQFTILRNYIQVLDVTGRISQKPLKNYLSATREVME